MDSTTWIPSRVFSVLFLSQREAAISLDSSISRKAGLKFQIEMGKNLSQTDQQAVVNGFCSRVQRARFCGRCAVRRGTCSDVLSGQVVPHGSLRAGAGGPPGGFHGGPHVVMSQIENHGVRWTQRRTGRPTPSTREPTPACLSGGDGTKWLKYAANAVIISVERMLASLDRAMFQG